MRSVPQAIDVDGIGKLLVSISAFLVCSVSVPVPRLMVPKLGTRNLERETTSFESAK